MTWMFGCSLDSKVTGSIGHQPLAVTPRPGDPARLLRRDSRWRRRRVRSKSVTSVRVALDETTRRRAKEHPLDQAG